MKRSEAIKNLLQVTTHSDLAAMYHDGMEVQVNVARCGGERVDHEYKGREYHAWTDSFQEWKSFRIPLNANSDPVDTDHEMSFDLGKYAESIGMTGWNWKEKKSCWVGFDFDSIAGHSEKHIKKLEASELEMIRNTIRDIPWVTLRSSTGGSGLHLYVFIENSPVINNHTEHAALARAILGKLAALTGFDFSSKVDVCGGNLWVMHTKTGPLRPDMPGLRLIKQGVPLTEMPINWRDHMNAVRGTTNRTNNMNKDLSGPVSTEATSAEVMLMELVSKRSKVPLDDDHKKLIHYLEDHKALWWWDKDKHMLVCHTSDLKDAHTSLCMKGAFETLAKGTERGQDINAYAFPMRNGAWSVRRYTPGVAEHEMWEQDGRGFTKIILNQMPDLKAAARSFGGVEHKTGGYVFDDTKKAVEAAKLLGIDPKVSDKVANRSVKLKERQDGKLIFEIENKAGTSVESMPGWLAERNNLTRIFTMAKTPSDDGETENYDDQIRHVISEKGGDYGWVINNGGRWIKEPLPHVMHLLAGQGLGAGDIKKVIGSCIARCWTLVNRPFEPEYLGDRLWNRDAAQLRFAPNSDKDQLHYPTWNRILTHVGKSLDPVVAVDHWCQDNNVLTGADYLKVWIATLFQKPNRQLPYLFLFGNQDSGKSILHESIALLMTKGYQSANAAIMSQGNFNGELETAILCYIEEISLAKNSTAYNRIKEWVTCLYMPIHGKGGTPFGVPNMTHWIQISNTQMDCPVMKGDSRIVVIEVDDLTPEQKIPKGEMITALEKEAPDFLAELMRISIPDSPGRLGMPVIQTDAKVAIEHGNRSELEEFVESQTFPAPGHIIPFAEFYDKFAKWLDQPTPIPDWSKITVGKQIKLIKGIVKGKIRKYSLQTYIANISFRQEETVYAPYEYSPTNSEEIIQTASRYASAIKTGETDSGEG